MWQSEPAEIIIASGMYSINGGEFSDKAGLVENGDKVKLRVVSSAEFSDELRATILIGLDEATFSVTTEAQDRNPTEFSIPSFPNIMPSDVIITEPLTISGINDETPIQISGGSISINDSEFQSEPTTIKNDDSFRLQVIAPDSFSSNTGFELTVGLFTALFSVSTVEIDESPVDFDFSSIANALVGSVQTSGTFTVSGINTSVPVIVENGEYSINGGEFTNAQGTIENNQAIVLKIDAPSDFSATKTMSLQMGNGSYSFSTTTEDQDIAPVFFAFPAKYGQERSMNIMSNTVQITGISGAVPISLTGGEYSIGESNFTADAGTVRNDEYITIRVTAAETFDSTRVAFIRVGDFSATFNVTTLIQDLTPDEFTFAPKDELPLFTSVPSAPVKVAGLTTGQVPISITNGEYAIGGDAFTSAPGLVGNETITLRGTTSESYGEPSTISLTVGSYSTLFVITTADKDTLPDDIFFRDNSRAVPNAWIESARAPVTDIDDDVPISVINGEYRIDGGEFTSIPGTISADQQIVLRHKSPLEESALTTTTITVGSLSSSFSSQTVDLYTNTSPHIRASLIDGVVIPNHINAIDGRVRNIKSADIDGDGDMDLFVSYYTATTDVGDKGLAWYENNGANAPQFEAHWISGGKDYSDLHPADIDNDGDIDFVCRVYNQPPVWFENDGAETPAFTERAIPAADEYSFTKARVADINGDTLPDIVFLSYRYDEELGRRADLYALINSDGAIFSSLELISLNVYLQNFSLGDVDGDSDIDIAAFDDANQIFLMKQNGEAQPQFTSEIISSSIPSFANFSYIEMGMVNADAHIDIAIADEYRERIYNFINNGEGGFDISIGDVTYVDEARFFEIVDVDQDGDGDFVTSSFKQSRYVDELDYLTWYQNTGTYGNLANTAFTRHYRDYDYGWHTAHAADLNGDGIVEIITDRANERSGNEANRPRLVWYNVDDMTFNVEDGTVSTIILSDSIFDPNRNLLEFSIFGGPDEQYFSITSGGVLTFDVPALGDNAIYKVWVAANDGFSSANFLISFNSGVP